MTTLFTHDDFDDHLVPPGHPECPDRLLVIKDHLVKTGIWNDLKIIEPSVVSDEIVGRTHSNEFLTQLASISPDQGLARIDRDTGMSKGSLQAAKRATGAVVQAVAHVFDGEDRRAFCLVRPPGHHAESDLAMGFCLLNSVAVAANYAREFVDRVAILDFDVHHCNGTVEIFQHRPDVLVCSTFQYPFFPNRYDARNRFGENIVNSPLQAGEGSYEFRVAVEEEWLPALHRFEPELILVSAGFDAHFTDPLGALQLLDDDYTWITREILSLSDHYADGRVVSALEGGYNLETIGATVEQHLIELLFN